MVSQLQEMSRADHCLTVCPDLAMFAELCHRRPSRSDGSCLGVVRCSGEESLRWTAGREVPLMRTRISVASEVEVCSVTFYDEKSSTFCLMLRLDLVPLCRQLKAIPSAYRRSLKN